MTRVAVVGGGITGLVAARRLATQGADVVLLEAAPRCGGKLARVGLAGLQLDAGAESVLARRPEAVDLIRSLGLGDRLVHPGPARPALLADGRIHPLPPSVMGVPTRPDQLESLLGAEPARRAAGEPGRAAPPLTGDVAIGDYVDQRFGAAVTDRLLEPMLGGVYAGRARTLSFDAVAHQLFVRARQGGSLSGHAAAVARPADGPVFAGLAGGIWTLVEALLADLADRRVELRTGTIVHALHRAGGRFRLACGVPGEGSASAVEADAVLLASPAPATARLAAELAPAAAEAAEIPYASVAVLSWLVRGIEPETSGLLVPPAELPTLKALTHSSVKWAWVADAAATTAGPGVAVVRASVGRWQEARTLQVDDATLLGRTFAEAAGLPGWEQAELVAGQVTRWGGSLPQYLVGHRERVQRVRQGLVPGLAVAGAAWDGVGIAACVGSAETAASALLDHLGGRDMIDDHDEVEESQT